MTNKEYKMASYNAYIAYVEYDEGKTNFADFVEIAFPAFHENGIELHNDETSRDILFRVVSHAMNATGTEKNEFDEKSHVRKVKSISTFRNMLKNWNEYATREVRYNAGKEPKAEEMRKQSKRVQEALAIMEACGIDITEELKARAANWKMAATVNK